MNFKSTLLFFFAFLVGASLAYGQCNQLADVNEGTPPDCAGADDVKQYFNDCIQIDVDNTGAGWGAPMNSLTCGSGAVTNDLWFSMIGDPYTSIPGFDGSLVLAWKDYPGFPNNPPTLGVHTELELSLLPFINTTFDCFGDNNVFGNNLDSTSMNAFCFDSSTIVNNQIYLPANSLPSLADLQGAIDTIIMGISVNDVAYYFQVESDDNTTGNFSLEISPYKSGFICGDADSLGLIDLDGNPLNVEGSVTTCLCETALNGGFYEMGSFANPTPTHPCATTTATSAWYKVTAPFANNEIKVNLSGGLTQDYNIGVITNVNCVATDTVRPGDIVAAYTDPLNNYACGDSLVVTELVAGTSLPMGDYYIVVSGETNKDQFTMDVVISEANTSVPANCDTTGVLVITEIMYNPPETNNDTLEFLELYNPGPNPVDIEGWYFGLGISDTITTSLVVPAGGFIIFCIDSQAFFNTFGLVAYEWESGALSNGGETVILNNCKGDTIDIVSYDDGGSWPTSPDGNGPSLGTSMITGDNDTSSVWCAEMSFFRVNGAGDSIFASPGGLSNCMLPACPTSTEPVVAAGNVCDGFEISSFASIAIQGGISDPDGTQLGFGYFYNANFTGGASIGDTLVHSGQNQCSPDTISIYVAAFCDADLDGNIDDTIPAGEFQYVVFPLPQMPTIVLVDSVCNYQIVTTCGDVVDSINVNLTATPGSPVSLAYVELSNAQGCAAEFSAVLFPACPLAPTSNCIDSISIQTANPVLCSGGVIQIQSALFDSTGAGTSDTGVTIMYTPIGDAPPLNTNASAPLSASGTVINPGCTVAQYQYVATATANCNSNTVTVTSDTLTISVLPEVTIRTASGSCMLGFSFEFQCPAGDSLDLNDPANLGLRDSIEVFDGNTGNFYDGPLGLNDSTIVLGYLVYNGVVCQINLPGSGYFNPNCSPTVAVEFAGITAMAQECSIDLRWSTGSEVNSDYFSIERSFDGVNYQAIGKVQASGNSQTLTEYDFSDNQPANGINYYRIVQVDEQGNNSVSEVVTANATCITYGISSVWPIPTNNQINIQINSEYDLDATIEIVDMLGRTIKVADAAIVKGSSTHTIDVSDMADAIYFVKLIDELERTSAIVKFVKGE